MGSEKVELVVPGTRVAVAGESTPLMTACARTFPQMIRGWAPGRNPIPARKSSSQAPTRREHNTVPYKALAWKPSKNHEGAQSRE